MILSESFVGDNNATLKSIQHQLYAGLLFYLFDYPRRRFIEACKLLEQDLELAERLEVTSSFDHRVLQDAHDIIAARYRYIEEEAMQPPLFSFLPHYSNDPIENRWCEYFHREVQRLTAFNAFTRALVIAVACQNTEAGYCAERMLCEFLVVEYGMGVWAPQYADLYS